MHTVLIVVHVITCLLIIAVVLIQQGRGADIGAVFGGGSSTVFGSSGAGNFLTRLTAGLAAIFMITAVALTYMGAYEVTGTVFDRSLPEPPPREVPAEQSAGSEPQAAAEPAQEPGAVPAGVAEQAPAPAAAEQAPAPAAEAQSAEEPATAP